MTTVHVGRPPRTPALVRAGRVFDRCVGYAVALLVLASVRWLAMGEAAPMLLSLLLASVVCGPRRPKTSSPRVRDIARVRGLRPLRRAWRLRRPMPALTPLPPVGG